jgi:hypothetical protein
MKDREDKSSGIEILMLFIIYIDRVKKDKIYISENKILK